LDLIAVHNVAGVDSKGCLEKSGKGEEAGRGDLVPQIVPWITTSNSIDAQHTPASEVSTAIIHDLSSVGAQADQTQVGYYYTSAVRFTLSIWIEIALLIFVIQPFLDPPVFIPSPTLSPPSHSEYDRENQHITSSLSVAVSHSLLFQIRNAKSHTKYLPARACSPGTTLHLL
jgi:hypothetical protein